jgi:nucleoside 2-deoxyribosyltransferase
LIEGKNVAEARGSCLICKKQNILVGEGRGPDGALYTCPRCGQYGADFPFLHFARQHAFTKKEVALLSHYTLDSSRGGKRPELTNELVDDLVTGRIPRPPQQARSILLWLSEELGETFGAKISVPPEVLCTIACAIEVGDVDLILEDLKNKGILQLGARSFLEDPREIGLTVLGWSEAERLLRTASDSQFAFMAMPFREAEIRENLKRYWKPAVEATGFELRPLNEEPEAGLIDNRMRVKIRKCRFLLAELTKNNSGAYWEAGYAEGLGRPVIYLCEESYFHDPKTHFDTNHCQTVVWNRSKMDDAVEELKATIVHTLRSQNKQHN